MPAVTRNQHRLKKPLPRLNLSETYEKLLKHWGPQGWWPGQSQVEIIAGAVLAQATSWENASAAVANLKSAGFLEDTEASVGSLLKLPLPDLARLVRSSGYYNQKAARLKSVLTFLQTNLGSPPWSIPQSKMIDWRNRLLSLKGLGPETADSILLYGFCCPVFVVDAYTRRMLTRHGMINPKTGYDDICKMFAETIPARSEIYNEYHALIVKLGKEHCRSVPCCDGCPLGPRG